MRLVLDTGAAGSVLDDERARSLGLETVGTHQSLGAGGVEQGSTVRGVDVELPGLKLVDQTMNTLSLSALSEQSGRPIDGILGRPLLSRCVVEIDYARKCASVFEPSEFKYRGSGVVLPLSFKDNLPYVTARVVLPDGRSLSGKFVIDTGAATNLILSSETIEREGVEASLGKTMSVQARGVGGAHDVRVARVKSFELGGFTIAEPVIMLQPAGPGYISAGGTIGNIGGGILSRFKVIFDYRHKRMILEPGLDLARPFEVDMSGLSLVAKLPDLQHVKVSRVLDGSPAMEAGIRPDDEIVSVNGTPIGEIGLPELREKLRVEGTAFNLELRRGEERVTVSITTRRMI